MSTVIQHEEFLQCPECEYHDVIVGDAVYNVEESTVTLPMYCDYCDSEWEVIFEYDHVNQL